MAVFKHFKHPMYNRRTLCNIGLSRTIWGTNVRKKVVVVNLPYQALRLPLQKELNQRVDDHLVEKS